MFALIIFLTAFIATFLSSMSGGGSSIIAIPIFLMLGIPFPLATSTQHFSSIFWVLPASYNYLKNQKVEWRFLIIFSIIGIIGVFIGIKMVVSVNQQIISRIIGAIILFLVFYTFFKKDVGLKENPNISKYGSIWAYLSAFFLGFYESIFGSGNGILFSIISFKTRGYDFIKALGSYYFVAFFWVLVSAILLVNTGFFDWKIMTPAVLGSVIGGFLGSKLGKYKGNKFIKIMFCVIGGILGLKLLLNL